MQLALLTRRLMQCTGTDICDPTGQRVTYVGHRSRQLPRQCRVLAPCRYGDGDLCRDSAAWQLNKVFPKANSLRCPEFDPGGMDQSLWLTCVLSPWSQIICSYSCALMKHVINRANLVTEYAHYWRHSAVASRLRALLGLPVRLAISGASRLHGNLLLAMRTERKRIAGGAIEVSSSVALGQPRAPDHTQIGLAPRRRINLFGGDADFVEAEQPGGNKPEVVPLFGHHCNRPPLWLASLLLIHVAIGVLLIRPMRLSTY